MSRERSLAPEARRALERASQSGAGSMDALRLAVESQALEPLASAADDPYAWRGQALRIVARMPMLAAAYARLRGGAAGVADRRGYAAAGSALGAAAPRRRARRSAGRRGPCRRLPVCAARL